MPYWSVLGNSPVRVTDGDSLDFGLLHGLNRFCGSAKGLRGFGDYHLTLTVPPVIAGLVYGSMALWLYGQGDGGIMTVVRVVIAHRPYAKTTESVRKGTES